MAQPHNHLTGRQRLYPFYEWIRTYRFSYLRYDLIAGLTVAAILIPQAMAYAMLAGLPPIYGLYTAAITPAIAALWGSLRQLTTGPIAIMSLLVLTTLSPMAEPGSLAFIELAFLLSLMIGFLYLMIGFLRLGIVMAFISHATVKGFTSAAAVIISVSQLPALLGVLVPVREFMFPQLMDIITGLPNLKILTTFMGLAAFVFIYTLKRVWPKFPSSLTALVITTMAVGFFRLDHLGVAVIGHIPAGLPIFKIPLLDFKTISELIGPAVVIALVSFAETYSVGKSISAQTRQHVDVDQEFIGQGMANLVGSFFQSYPVSGSFSRTAINFSAGAKTGLSGIISSFSVILALLFLTPLLSFIPKTILAAIVISAVMTLFHPREVFTLWQKSRHDGIVAVTVFGLALVAKPDYALLIGVIISLVFFLWKTMHPKIIRMTKDPDLNIFLDADDSGKPSCPQILYLRSDNVLYFANADYTIEHVLERVDSHSGPIKKLLLDFQAVGFVDITGIDELRILTEELVQRDIQLALIGVNPEVKKSFERASFLDVLGPENLMKGPRAAIATLFKSIDHVYCKKVCPYSLFYECQTVK